MKRLFTIFTEKEPEVRKLLQKYERKAASYGTPFECIFTQPYIKKIPLVRSDPYTGAALIISSIPCEVTDVIIDAADIKLNGWTVVAKLEHYENGNIVWMYSDEPILNKWKTAKPYCDHCRTSRQRNVTYICRHDDGRESQVGSSCLKDYTGIDPALAIWWAQAWFPEVPEFVYEEKCDFVCGKARVYDVAEVIAHAVDSVTKHGYRKSHEPGATRVDVYERLRRQDDPSPEAKEKAEKILAWLRENKTSFKYTTLEETCCTLAEIGHIKSSHLGFLAYLPVAYDKFLERQAQQRRQREMNANSTYIGEVGKRITLPVVSCRCLTSWDTGYGTETSIYKFMTDDGNVLIWKTSKHFGDVTKVRKITGTVKQHQEYAGVKQTELTRCKVESEGRNRDD